MRYLPALAAPVFAAVLAYLFNLPQSLGAHPWWSQSVILIGLPLGLALAGLLACTPLSRRAALSVTGAATLAAAAIATTGKARFAASYAEDVFAGQMWYFGWIATCALAAAVLAAMLWPPRPGH